MFEDILHFCQCDRNFRNDFFFKVVIVANKPNAKYWLHLMTKFLLRIRKKQLSLRYGFRGKNCTKKCKLKIELAIKNRITFSKYHINFSLKTNLKIRTKFNCFNHKCVFTKKYDYTN